MSRVKKTGCLLLALITLVVGVFAESGFKIKAEVLTIYKVVGENVRLRSAPTASDATNILTEITNSEVTYISEKKNDLGELWYEISYTDATGKKYKGFVISTYVQIQRYATDDSFEATLELFPESYHEGLTKLHAQFPNWKFIADQVDLTFDQAVVLEDQNNIKQVQGNELSYRSMGLGSYDWASEKYIASNGGWYGASRQMIKYYMDPRNFLDSVGVIMFLQQGYDEKTQTLAGVKTIIKGSFLEKNYTYTKTVNGVEKTLKGNYANDIMEAAKQSGVSPYVLASMIIQEQGVNGTSPLISGTYKGYEGCYNFFNVSASGATNTEVIVNGLNYAKAKEWKTRRAAIIGGAQFYANGYINSGQDTFYYKNFNVHNPDKVWHQYAQAIHDSHSSAKHSAAIYTSNANGSLTFKIPVYKGMPAAACKKPQASNKQNNYYLLNIDAGSGLAPSFDKFVYDYTLNVLGDTSIGIKLPKGAIYSSDESFEVKAGNNLIRLQVTSETGYKNTYRLHIVSTGEFKINIKVDGEFEEEIQIALGDVNADSKISLADLAAVQMHLLSVKSIEEEKQVAADVNKDGKISLADLAAIQMHLLGVKKIGV